MPAVSLSNIEVRTLFEAWGFAPESGNGGHLTMRHQVTGSRVQIAAPGRKDGTPYRALKKAADICGVTLHEFKLGPPTDKADRSRSKGDVTDDNRTELAALDDELQRAHRELAAPSSPNGDGGDDLNGAAAAAASSTELPRWQCEDLGISARVLEFLRAHPHRPFSASRVADETGLEQSQVTPALSNLTRSHPESVFRPTRGHYEYDDTVLRGNEEERRRAEELERQLAEERERSNFTLVAEDKHGRVVLNDAEGEMWIAIRVEPHFHSFK